jgi:hypothetical protein
MEQGRRMNRNVKILFMTFKEDYSLCHLKANQGLLSAIKIPDGRWSGTITQTCTSTGSQKPELFSNLNFWPDQKGVFGQTI